FQRLLPLVAPRGWDSVEALVDAVAPAGRGGDGELVVTIKVDVEEVLGRLLVEEAGWRPGEEPAEAAMARYRRRRRAERGPAYALVATYQAFGPRLAALPPCGECGDLTNGCLGGGACTKADLATRAAWAPFEVDFDAGEQEDPEVVERRARAVLLLLPQERDL